MSWPKAALVILAGLAMGMFCLYRAWSGYRDHRALQQRGEPTSAQVVSVDFSGRGPDEVEVVFLDASETRHQTEVERKSGSSVGDTIEIVYDPEHPNNAEEVEGSHQFPSPRVWWGQLFWFLTGGFFIAGSVSAAIRVDRRDARPPGGPGHQALTPD